MNVYLDHNATTPLDERVLEAMLPLMGATCGNPSSVHRFGRLVRAALDRAREQVAALVGVGPTQVIFTSGGTEANNLALKGVAMRNRPGRLAISAVEHASVRSPAKALASLGWTVDTIAVDAEGRVTADALEEAVTAETRLVSVMAANNETGVLQDISALAGRLRERRIPLHTDAVQLAGKAPLDFAAMGAQLMSLSAHKIHGPQGVGALIVDKALDVAPLIDGGGQERGYRGGTENLAGIVGFGAAAELAAGELEWRAGMALALRQALECRLGEALPEVVVFGAGAERLPNTVFLALPGIDGESLLMALDRKGIAVSSGAACGSGRTDPSHVLSAMGIDGNLARGAIRVSVGKDNTEQDIEQLVDALREQANRVRMAAGAWA